MSIKVKVYGEKLDLADELQEEFHAQAKAAISDVADLVLGEVARLLHLRKGTLRTSAPEGEPPEVDTEALAQSFRRIPARIKGRVATSGIQSNDPGANRLEFGKTDSRGIRTLPHPFVRPAIETVKIEATALLEQRLT